MKTLREILLEKHRATAPKLDQVRRRAVRAALRPADAPPRDPLWRLFWREFVQPSRGWWTALAGVWMMTLTLRLLCLASDEPRHPGSAPPLSAAELSILREQREWMAEGFREDSLWTEPKKPGPRGDRIRRGKSG